MADRVELTDLDVISRYSVAVRAATVDRDELIAALRADLEWLEGKPAPVARKAPAKSVVRAAAKAPAKAAAKKTAARRTR